MHMYVSDESPGPRRDSAWLQSRQDRYIFSGTTAKDRHSEAGRLDPASSSGRHPCEFIKADGFPSSHASSVSTPGDRYATRTTTRRESACDRYYDPSNTKLIRRLCSRVSATMAAKMVRATWGDKDSPMSLNGRASAGHDGIIDGLYATEAISVPAMVTYGPGGTIGRLGFTWRRCIADRGEEKR